VSRTFLLWVAMVMLAGCSSPEHQLLASGSPGGRSSPSNPGGNQPGGGNQGTGGCSSGDCSQHRACESDRDCEGNPGSVCVGDQCVGCDALETIVPLCTPGWVPVLIDRNGCAAWKCSPVGACARNEDCPPGEWCYPGMDCVESGTPGMPPPLPPPPPPGPGGQADPAMCRGNLCGPPSCPGTERLDCLVVGCENNFTCQSSCTSPFCTCDPMTLQWVCGTGCGASACVPPS
jgi:hypothetical protein